MISRLFNGLNGRFPGPSIFVFMGNIGKPHAILQLKVLSYAECKAYINMKFALPSFLGII